jgi:Rrf2 family iron-sulfur cluster assembly transcriptional regulator
VLLSIWSVVGTHMREHLDGYSLADVASQARGEAPWPETVSERV